MAPKYPIKVTEGEPIFVAALKTEVDTAISGQISVATAGVEVRGPNVPLENGVYIKALPGNADVVYVGNDGNNALPAGSGYVLDAGELVLSMVTNLSQLWFDAASNGDGFCWMKA